MFGQIKHAGWCSVADCLGWASRVGVGFFCSDLSCGCFLNLKQCSLITGSEHITKKHNLIAHLFKCAHSTSQHHIKKLVPSPVHISIPSSKILPLLVLPPPSSSSASFFPLSPRAGEAHVLPTGLVSQTERTKNTTVSNVFARWQPDSVSPGHPCYSLNMCIANSTHCVQPNRGDSATASYRC